MHSPVVSFVHVNLLRVNVKYVCGHKVEEGAVVGHHQDSRGPVVDKVPFKPYYGLEFIWIVNARLKSTVGIISTLKKIYLRFQFALKSTRKLLEFRLQRYEKLYTSHYTSDLHVQHVCRLVQEEQVRLGEERPRQGDPHAPAT